MTCTDFEELSGAYVLDAISPEEQQEADHHLAECAHCRALVHELRAALDYLPLSVPQREPSASVKEHILNTIQEDAAANQSIQHIDQMRARKLRRSVWQTWRNQLLALAAVLLLLLLVGMGAWNISLQQQINHLSVNTPVTYTLQGTSTHTGISGELIYYPQQHISVLIMRGLAQPDGTQVYQGWLLKGKQPISIGLLNIENGVATLDYMGNLTDFNAAAVSLEPGPQASPRAPVGPVLALGTLH